jgi:uncharacterized membrane-anchored protein
MIELKAIIDRVPRVALFVAAGLIQVVLIAVMVIDRVGILRSGSEVMLRTRPVDPRDFLRGDYVTLSYEISDIPAGDLKGMPFRKDVFVILTPDAEGFYKAIAARTEPVPVNAPDVLIRANADRYSYCSTAQLVFCDRLRLTYGIESYFVPQGEGRSIEQTRNQGKVAIVAAVTPTGRAAIKRLLVDRAPVYEEPLF